MTPRFLLFPILALSCALRAAEFHVSPAGNDTNAGTAGSPFATLEAARDAARKAGGGANRIVVLPGDYYLTRPFTLGLRDNGLTIEGADPGKAKLYGGKPIIGWRRDGERFWRADLPEVKAGKWDFRVLLVNGRMAEHARYPETGTLQHQSIFDVRWLSSVAGGWERPPTHDEMTLLRYNPKDIPPSLEPRNAEVRIYHMWDESLVGVTAHAPEHHTLRLTIPRKPPGAFKIQDYVVFNTREGMTHPGQWYLDRTAGLVVYWPLPGEEISTVRAVAPTLERVVEISGTTGALATNITLRGLSIQATTTPLRFAGFAAEYCDGAVRLENASRCHLENLVVANVGGQGILALGLEKGEISNCVVHHTGGTGIWAAGSDFKVAGNRIHHIGVIHLSAVGVHVDHKASPDGKGFHLYRNEISEVSYCGVHGLGANNLLEENLIYRVMLEMHDGAGIYGMMSDTILRGNLVRDVVKVGKGYDVPAYYLDEGSEKCLLERNVSSGVEVAVKSHMARKIAVRDNVFMVEKDMMLDFLKSSDCTFEGNTLYVPGKLTIGRPVALVRWNKNILFRNDAGKAGEARGFEISDAMPVMTPPVRHTPAPEAARISRPPEIDGEVKPGEWPGRWVELSRDPSGWEGAGAPAFVSLAYDERCLYVALRISLFDVSRLRRGSDWAHDDAVELSINRGKGGVILHGFANGEFRSVPEPVTNGLQKEILYSARVFGKTKGDFKSGWRCEWAIPFAVLGIKPTPGLKIDFNAGVRRTEDGIQRYLEISKEKGRELEGTVQVLLK